MSVAPREPGEAEERERGRVPERVNDRDATRRSLRIGGVDETRQRGGRGRDDTEPDEEIGRAAGPSAAGEVEHERARPGSDDDVRKRRVQRVPKPGAAEEILKLGARAANRAARSLQQIRVGVERLELAYPFRERLPFLRLLGLLRLRGRRGHVGVLPAARPA